MYQNRQDHIPKLVRDCQKGQWNVPLVCSICHSHLLRELRRSLPFDVALRRLGGRSIYFRSQQVKWKIPILTRKIINRFVRCYISRR